MTNLNPQIDFPPTTNWKEKLLLPHTPVLQLSLYKTIKINILNIIRMCIIWLIIAWAIVLFNFIQ